MVLLSGFPGDNSLISHLEKKTSVTDSVVIDRKSPIGFVSVAI